MMANIVLYFTLLTVFHSCFISHAGFVRTPAKDSNTIGTLKNSLDLKCEYSGEDFNGRFDGWYKDGVPVAGEKPGHYVVHDTDHESVLTIKIFVKEDHEVKKWYVKTTKPGYEQPRECTFNQIQLKPSPQRMESDRGEILDVNHGSVRRDKGQSVALKCIVEPEFEDNSNVTNILWTFSKNDESYSVLPSGVRIVKKDTIQIDEVDRFHRGYYRCTVNSVSFTVLLRVKDRLAALWPFLGIIGVVLLLVIIILIFEKRQKSAKKSAGNDDDDAEHTKDPLVRSANKAGDDENKKRAVKA